MWSYSEDLLSGRLTPGLNPGFLSQGETRGNKQTDKNRTKLIQNPKLLLFFALIIFAFPIENK